MENRTSSGIQRVIDELSSLICESFTIKPHKVDTRTPCLCPRSILLFTSVLECLCTPNIKVEPCSEDIWFPPMLSWDLQLGFLKQQLRLSRKEVTEKLNPIFEKNVFAPKLPCFPIKKIMRTPIVYSFLLPLRKYCRQYYQNSSITRSMA